MRKTPNAELDRKTVTDFKAATKNPFVIVLDNVRSFHNVGSVFRTADAFLLEGIYLCGICPRPPHRDIRKTALGASDSVKWQYFEQTIDAIQQLKADGYRIIAIEQADDSISLENYALQPQQKYALIFGHEVKGVDPAVMQLIDDCIEIPQFGTKHSLNISVSAGVVTWDFWCKYNASRK